MLEDPAVVRRLRGLRSWTLSGEPVRIQVLRDLQEALPRCEFINLYGASEVSSDATYFKWRRFDGERLPVGWPVPNARIYILDRHGEPVPLGVTGEIHVGGVGVGQGYLNRPELTQSRFVPDPFSGVPHGRLYKTGDLGRWRADGLLECLGRADQQVKVRGFRIELSEIETQLVRHPQVKEALVTAREDVPGERRLVAYVTRRETADRGVLSERLRAYLKEQLPEFMVPGAVVLLETLPRTPNGKLDRRSLPPPAPQDYTDHEYESPRGELEEALADIWKELLGIERVGRANNFFDLGGDSLSAARVITRIGHLLELRVPLAAFFEEPTLQGLGKSILTQIVTETSMEVS
jgi:acyl-coenzyme A synthetase/AMP-(fatty) acid ligase/acyl carrier protein